MGRLRSLVVLLPVLLAVAIPLSARQAGQPVFRPGECPFQVTEAVEDVECGVLVVPENRDAEGGPTIELAVAVLPGLGPSPEPDALVFVSGGPGGGSLEGVPGRARHGFWRQLRQQRDLVFFDQRGTGYSEPEFCPEMDDAIGTSMFRGLSEAELGAVKIRAAADCRQRMEARGVDLTAYNSAASARDLADLRRALGYDSWNLISISYGTRLVLTVLRDQPEGVRSVILDSTLPPDVGQWVAAGERFSGSLGLAFEQCAADPDCRAAFPSLEEDFYAVIADLEADPIVMSHADASRFPEGRMVVDGALWAQGVFQGFYDRSFVPVFPLMVRESKRRNLDVLRALGDGIAKEPGGTRWGMNYAVNCYEQAPLNPADRMLANRERYPGLAPWFETGFRSPVMHEVCEAWHDARAGEDELRPVRSEVPALILAGEFDPITPPGHGRRAARTLPNATFVEVPAMGHGVSPFTPCTRRLIETFLEAPGQELDTSCVAELPSHSFVTDVHLNPGVYRFASALRGEPRTRLVGLLLGIVLLSAVVGWPVVALWRRLRHRPAGRSESGPGIGSGIGPRAARGVGFLTATLGLLFLVGLVVTVRRVARDNSYLLAFGVPSEAAWVLLLPWAVAALTLAAVVLSVLAWRRGWWSRAGRVHYATVAAACAGVVASAAYLGLM